MRRAQPRVMKTKHSKAYGADRTFKGDHLFEVSARTPDGQSARAVIAANDEYRARTRLMLVQGTMKPRGQEVTFVVEQLPDPKRVSVDAARIQALADRTADAWSCERYSSWKACAAAVLRRGYSDRQAEEILRSKITRWAADGADKRDGRATAADLLRFMDSCRGETRALLAEVGLS